MRRDLKLSVSRNNRDIYDIWRSIQAVDPHPSSTVIKWIRERYALEWKNRNKVLSPPQQKEVVTTPKYVRPPKTDAEIQKEKKQKEDELIKEQEKARQRVEEIARIKRIMGKQD